MKWAFNLIQVWAFGAIKLSVIFFYRKIFRGKLFDISSKVLIGIVICWTLAFFFTNLFQCGTDFSAIYSTLHNYLTHCTGDLIYQKAFLYSDVFTDAFILAMPVPLVYSSAGFYIFY